jgi:exodeoxyribonuclease VII large subunit
VPLACWTLPCDGDLVEVRGRLGVYEPRGDLQLMVESMRQAGAGACSRSSSGSRPACRRRACSMPQRKRELPLMPRAIGLVTSLGAAALHDVVTAPLQRRVPHIPVLLAPAPVQGAGAAAQLVQALEACMRWSVADATTQDGEHRRGGRPTSSCWCAAAVRSRTCGPSTTRRWRG